MKNHALENYSNVTLVFKMQFSKLLHIYVYNNHLPGHAIQLNKYFFQKILIFSALVVMQDESDRLK